MPLKPISDGFSELQVGTFLNKSCPRNQHCNTTAFVAEIEYLGEAAMDIAVSERQSERPNPTRPQGKPRPQGYKRR